MSGIVRTWGAEYADTLNLLKEQRDEAVRLYNELIMEVICSYDGETTHQTALRYIREGEHPKKPVPNETMEESE